MKNPAIAIRKIVKTEDHSYTLKLEHFDEQYHSIHGAINESTHIFINSGLKVVNHDSISILEIGFGTGLNALLTYYYKGNKKIFYTGIEAFPLTEEEWTKLNYVDLIDPTLYNFYHKLHQSEENQLLEIGTDYYLKKINRRLEEISLQTLEYHLIYFDAFSPHTQPELWKEEIFEKMYQCMQTNGILITYCAKGSVKRALKNVGFEVEGLPGPVGKREITRCVKK
ncbi:MAG: tRNA (5-methylaminomethyl-2-thiouridine)(34)-methyltransferase MnmD [Bacteroidales bacterium]